IIGLGVVLILVILFLLFRSSSLVNLAKKPGATPEDERVDSSNSTNAALMLIVTIVGLAGFFWYSVAYFDDYALPVASEHGVWIDTIFWITMAVTVVAFSIISFIIGVFAYKYQHRRERKAKFYPDNHYLELAWTIIPAVVLSLLIFTGLRSWNEITSPASEEAEVIEVIGQQFAWTARYPGNKDNTLGKYNYKLIRSEERRVGKVCRSRWSTGQARKN